MKKVLFFIPEFPRLTETFIEREVSKLISLGELDISVFSIKKASGALSENVVQKVIYKRLNLFDFLLGFCYFVFVHPDRVKKAFKLILGKDKMPIFSRGCYFLKAFGYAWLFKKLSPEHIHVHFLSWPSTVGMITATLLDLPYSISAHARDVLIDGTLIPAKVKTAKFVSICNKFAWQSCIDQSGVTAPPNVYQQYHGIDVSSLSMDNPSLEKSSRPYIFVGSRLVEKKGLRYIIEASKILKEREVSHEIHIAGPGPMYKELMLQIEDMGVSDTVFIHGEGKGIPWNDIVELFKITDIVAYPSINTDTGDADGVPTFVIEAALCKLPIISTNAGSITDLIENEKTGLLVKQADAGELADALERLIFDESLRNSLGKNAYEKARGMFDLDVNIRAFQALFFK